MAGKTVKQLYGNGSGQSFMDRVNAAKHSFTGSGLAKVVCKATTEEMAAPKKKHLEYLVQCTFEQNVSIPELANLLIERTQQSNWVIVFKSLITIHHLMNFGNERFFQYLASNNSQLSLSNFNDRTGIQAYDMSKFVRQYSRYVEQKSRSYRDMAFDFCKIKRGKEEGVLRKMTAEKLMKTIPILETQLDSMLDFDISVVANGSEIHHSIVYAAFLLLYKDAIRLFATYNDGIINLIEKYFTMTKKQCKEALDCYKKFTKRMDRLNKFLRLSEEIGFGESNGLELQPVPLAVLEALENHLNMLEGKKVNESSSGSSQLVSATTNQKPSNHNTEHSIQHKDTYGASASFCLSDADKLKIIEEEKAKLEEFASKRSQNATKAFTAMQESVKHQPAFAPNASTTSSSGSSLPAIPLSSSSSNQQRYKPNGSSTNPYSGDTVASNTTSKKISDDLVLLDLDPNPNAMLNQQQQQQQQPYISREVADLFGVNTSSVRTQPQNQQQFMQQSVIPTQQQAPMMFPHSIGYHPAASHQHTQPMFNSNQQQQQLLLSSNVEINFDRAFANKDTKVSSSISSNHQQISPMKSQTTLASHSSANQLMSLDDKLASLVGNLDISQAAKIQSQAVTSVNWGGPPHQNHSNNNTSSITATSNNQMFNTKSVNSSTPGSMLSSGSNVPVTNTWSSNNNTRNQTPLFNNGPQLAQIPFNQPMNFYNQSATSMYPSQQNNTPFQPTNQAYFSTQPQF